MSTRNNRNARKRLTLLFSIFPGGGHFYLGLMRRGAFYSLLILLSIALSSVFYLSALSFFLGLSVFIISIFDAYHCWRMMQEDGIEVVDAFPLEGWFHERFDYMEPERKRKYLRAAGIVLLVLGGLSFLSMFAGSGFFSGLAYLVVSLAFPALLVILGLYLIRRGRRQNDDSLEE